jgi:hypothetical protein
VGRVEPLTVCAACHRFRPAGAPGCAQCVAWIDADIDGAWNLHELDGPPALVAEAVLADPRTVPWRVVDAAMRRITCYACGEPLGGGPMACEPCRLAHGNRFYAAEPDRTDVPPGNEHAIRVSTVVARWPQWFPAHMVPLYAFTLPLLHAGDLPTTPQAQAIKSFVDDGGDLDLFVEATSFTEVTRRIRGRGTVRAG